MSQPNNNNNQNNSGRNNIKEVLNELNKAELSLSVIRAKILEMAAPSKASCIQLDNLDLSELLKVQQKVTKRMHALIERKQIWKEIEEKENEMWQNKNRKKKKRDKEPGAK